jgi:dolichol-phosphate mannosyltransferase
MPIAPMSLGLEPDTGNAARAPQAAARKAPELTIVIPTFNERDNVPVMIERLRGLPVGIDWEAVFVDDDSPDGTASVARTAGEADARIRCIRRIGRRGLSGALLEGMLASQARFVAALDGDLQHDETLLAAMIERMRRDDVDLIVASRNIAGGSAASFTPWRARASRWATMVACRVLGVDLSDPMSGFFMIRREVIEDIAPRLSSQGFKLLLDVVATGGSQLRIAELPYLFRGRRHGHSKLDSKVALDYLALVIAKATRDTVSLRFLLFCLVGSTGIAAHMVALTFALDALRLDFLAAQTVATLLAITWNFSLNNHLTYRDQRLTGRHWVTGLIRFQLICVVGAVSNVGAAGWLYGQDSKWWVAGLGGALMGAVWNYVISAAFVWRIR